MKQSLTITPSPEEIVKRTKAFEDKAKQHFVQGVLQMAEATMELSKSAFVPVVTGTLRSSGFVGELVKGQENYSVDIGYGGAASSYAAAVHFRSSRIGQHKNLYLTKPMRLMIRQGDQMMSAWMKQLYSAAPNVSVRGKWAAANSWGAKGAPTLRSTRAPRLKP